VDCVTVLEISVDINSVDINIMLGLVVLGLVIAVEPGPCCRTCTLPKAMYISVVSSEPFCGQTCIDPKDFNIFHVFEKNLTRDPGGACARQYAPDGRFYTVYNTTVTHGVPGILAVTLDLYAPAVNASL
jgi:hypothetical protein